MKTAVKIIAVTVCAAALGLCAFFVNRAADNIKVETENDIPPIIIGKNTHLPDGLTVFSDDGKTSDIHPAMWRVTSPEGKQLYMLGTMHAVMDECYPLPDYIHKAFDGCEKLSCEINNVDLSVILDDTEIELDPKLPDGETLEQHMSAAQYDVLKSYFAVHGIDISEYNGFQPWFIYQDVLNSAEGSQEGVGESFSATIGIDRILKISSNIADKEILELETREAKQTMFSSIPEDVMGAVIEQYCNIGDEGQKKIMSSSYNAWKTGDLDAIEKLTYSTEGVSAESVPLIEQYHKLFVIDRNRIMTDKIEGYLKNGEKVFVIAGAAHFCGSEGIPSLLEKDGFTVERVE